MTTATSFAEYETIVEKNPDGTIKSETVFADGVLRAKTEYTEKGKVETAYYETGTPQLTKFYNSNGLYQVVQWYSNGNKRQELNYQNGKKHGREAAWYDDGQISRIANFKEGNPSGGGKKWDRLGNLTLEIDENGNTVFRK